MNDKNLLKEILERHRKFIDRRDVPEGMGNISICSKVQACGMAGESVSYFQFPDKFSTEIKLGCLSRKEIFDGKKLVAIDRNGHAQEKRDLDDLDGARLTAYMATFAYLQPLDFAIDVVYDEAVILNGRLHHKIRYSTGRSGTIIHFLDAETGELKRSQALQLGINVIEEKGDYHQHGGVMFAHRSSTLLENMDGMELDNAIVEITIGEEFSFDPFSTSLPAASDFLIANRSGRTRIAFRLINNHIILKAAIDNNRKGEFVLDSGAMATVLDESYAEHIGLQLDGRMAGVGATGFQDTRFTRTEAIRVGNCCFAGQTVAVMDFGVLKDQLHQDFAGLIGYDVFSRLVTMIDYQKSFIELIDPLRFTVRRGYQEISARNYNNIFMISFTLAGVCGNFLIDTGSNSCIDISRNFGRLSGLADEKGLHKISMAGLGGNIDSLGLEDYEVSFLGQKIKISIGIHDHEKGVFADREVDGIIGSGFLKKFKMILDYPRWKIYLKYDR